MTNVRFAAAALLVALGLHVAALAKIPANSDVRGAPRAKKEPPSLQTDTDREIVYEDGIYTISDGSCVRLTVFDQGHTHVTIDAKGTLHPMKNNLIETVSVDCP